MYAHIHFMCTTLAKLTCSGYVCSTGAQRKQSLSDKLAASKDIQRAKRSKDSKDKRAMSLAGKRIGEGGGLGRDRKSEANIECY